jgi:hypothetical protein
LQRAWTPEPVPDSDPGFTGVTTFYKTVKVVFEKVLKLSNEKIKLILDFSAGTL